MPENATKTESKIENRTGIELGTGIRILFLSGLFNQKIYNPNKGITH